MNDKPIKAVFNPISDGGGIVAKRTKTTQEKVNEAYGYKELEGFIEEFGEVAEFHNINLAIRAFLGQEN